MGAEQMSTTDWVERARFREAVVEYAEANERSSSCMWVMYEGEPHFYVSDRDKFPREPESSLRVYDKELLNYARTLWELGK
jgi:hypothetical protein